MNDGIRDKGWIEVSILHSKQNKGENIIQCRVFTVFKSAIKTKSKQQR